MANRAIEPVTLPWKRPEKGVSVAEMGASFRVELREDGWHCTVNVGRRAEVLAAGLRRLRDAQCRAEAHAATLPEVAAAREKLAAEESSPAADTKQRPAKATKATDPRPVPPATTPGAEAPSLAFEQVSDGCICGKIDGGTWVADPGGGVSVPTGTDPAVAQEICRVAAAHYTARRAATTPAKTTARASTKPASKRGGRKAKPDAAEPPRAAKPDPAEKPAPARRAERARKPAQAKKATPKKKKAKPTKEPAAPMPASTSKPSKAPRTEKGKATSKKAAAKTTTPKAPARGRKASTTAERPAATPTPSGKAAAKPAARGRKAGKARATKEKQAAAPTPPAKEEKVSKKPAKNSKPPNDASCGCVTWTAVDGKIRGAAKNGTFVVEPEGKRHALYFYDADGQSRHLESGDAGKLRKIADEMAARGQPAPRAAVSGVDDAALMRAFLGDDA